MGLGLTQDGYLTLRISNNAQLAVSGVRVVVGVRAGGGIREQASYRLDRVLDAGGVAQMKTDLGPMDVGTARRFAALVTDARLAK